MGKGQAVREKHFLAFLLQSREKKNHIYQESIKDTGMLYSAIKQSTRVAHDTWEGWFYIFKINKSQQILI